ncbi:hypothetical protein RJ640_019304, partial [Escallonia rubra]
MESMLKDFNLPANPSEEVQRRWRMAVGLVRNRRRRFRFVPDLDKRIEDKDKLRQTQEKVRLGFNAYRIAFRFIDGVGSGENKQWEEDGEIEFENGLSEEARESGFRIHPDKLANIVHKHEIKVLRSLRGADGVASKLNVVLGEGVKSSDVSIRQKIYGFNRYSEKPSKSFLTFLGEALQDLTLIILIVCAVVSIGVGLATEGWPKGIYDGLGIILCILLIVFVTASSDYNQSLQFKDLDKEKKKIILQVSRDGYRQKVSIYDLVVGDVVHLSIGDQVPADGIFISGYSLLLDESSLTGESEPINVNEKNPFLLAGTKVQNGSGKMLVTTVGMRTEWGKLMETLSDGGDDETPLQVKLNGVATVIGKIGLGFAVLTFVVLIVRYLVEKALQHEFTSWSFSDAAKILNFFATAVTILVVAVPEGLPLAVTLSLAFAMKKMMSDKALVRRLSACETMGSATCICTDKTGTLTTNHMVVDKIWLCGNAKEIKGSQGTNTSSLEVSENVLTILLQAIFQNTESEVVKDKDGKNTILGSPTESALLEYGLLLGGSFDAQRREVKILKVDPFNSDKKMMSVLVALPGGGNRAFCKGASEIVLKMCDKILNSNGESVQISEEQVRKVTDAIDIFACEALRTLCVAFKDINDTFDDNSIPDGGYTLIAVVGIKDPVRPGVKNAVQTCLAAGITVRMVTGDNINTAKAIAKECGILTEDGVAIEGPVFRSKAPEDMMEIIPKIQVMARSSPLDKHKLVTYLRSMFKEVVAVTGDGTNDAPALKESDIGLAMGIAGTEVAKENAHIIILDDNFSTIVTVAKWGRAVYINIQKFVQFQLTVNVVALMLSFVSACVTGTSPLTTVQMLWVNLIMDTLGALALATEAPHDGLMNRPPIGRSVSFITKAMWRNIFGHSIYQLAVLFVLTFAGKKLLKLEGSDADDILQTVIFNAFVFCQVFNEINSRDIEKINIFRGIFSSKLFMGIVVSTVIFQVVIVEFLGSVASTVPLSWQLWLLSVVVGLGSIPVAVVLKCIPVETKPAKHHNGYDLLPSGPGL